MHDKIIYDFVWLTLSVRLNGLLSDMIVCFIFSQRLVTKGSGLKQEDDFYETLCRIPPVSQTAFNRSDFKNIGDFEISLLWSIFSKAHYCNDSFIDFCFALRPGGKQLMSCRGGGGGGKLS